ncbi:MAG: hypothetical protein WC308_01930 [archaeon]|jgi:hypothetical protein
MNKIGAENLFSHFCRGFFAAFLVMLLFMSSPAFALSFQNINSDYVQVSSEKIFLAETTTATDTADSSTSTTTSETTDNSATTAGTAGTTTSGTADSTTSNNVDGIDYSNGSSCVISSLTPKESKAIMNITSDGFDGKILGDGIDTNEPGKKIDGAQIVGESNDGKNAVTQKPPNEMTDAERFKFLADRHIEGPWGLGLVLDDTLRVGRCADLQSQACWINDPGLSIRTSGTGFSSDITNAVASLSDVAERSKINMTDQEYEKLKQNIVDQNDSNFTNISWASGEKIKNSILTKSYGAKNATSCNNSNCAISTYSAFDKYYNSWFSTDLVVFNIGPTFFNQATRGLKSIASRVSTNVGKEEQTILGKGLANLNKTYSKIATGIKETPANLVGVQKMSQFWPNVQKHGFGPAMDDLIIKKKLFSNGAQGFVSDMLSNESQLMKLTPLQREQFFDDFQTFASYVKASNVKAKDYKSVLESAMKNYDDAIKVAGTNTDAIKAAQQALNSSKVDVARDLVRMGNEWDDITRLDVPEWVQNNEDLFSLQGLSVKKNGVANVEQGAISLTGKNYDMKSIMKEFEKNGNWDAWKASLSPDTFEVTEKGIQLYKVVPNKLEQSNVRFEDLTKWIKQYGDGRISVKLTNGNFVELSESGLGNLSKNQYLPASIDIYKTGFEKAEVLTPEDFAARITHSRMFSRYNTAENNVKDLTLAMAEKNFKPRKALSVLDRQFALEDNMLKQYFKDPLRAGIWKGTVMPILYWNAKRGFGNEDYSAYMLPDSWTTTAITQGVDRIYNDSFIDFFANEGSDQGDLFAKAINSFIFPIRSLVLDPALSTVPQLKEWFSRFSGEGGLQAGITNGSIMRDTVKDIAFYSHNEKCDGCGADMTYKDDYLTFGGFKITESAQVFLLEATDADEKAKEGTTLIAYTHHSNIKGKTGDIEGEAINLVDGRKDGETCDQKLREIGLGWAGTGAGGILAFGENMAYVINPGFGLIASGIQQVYLAPKLKDCVDDAEGYYIHFYMPPSEKAKTSQPKELISNETLTSTAAKIVDSVNGAVAKNSTDNSQPNVVSSAMDKLKQQFSNFSEQAQKANVLQATIKLDPLSTGGVTGKDVFYIWYKGSIMPSGYSTEGKIIWKDGNKSLEVNNETGEIKYNGKVVVPASKADHTRMATTPADTRIPAIVVPKTLTKIAAPEVDSPVFELNTNGEVRVVYAEVLSCIQKAVEAQTGIVFSGDELTQAFGALKNLKTSDYSGIFVQGGKIYLEGTGNRTQGVGSDSKVIVDGFWETKFSDNGKEQPAGKFVSMNFDYGVIALKPETNELIVWLRQHKDSVLDAKDVAGLTATKTSIIDPETECPVPALNLAAQAYPNDDLGQKKVTTFNQSMDHLGPFTQFITDGRIYEFYSKRDPTSGDCKDYFRIRDKDTGKIIKDSEIVGGVEGIKQLEDGTLVFSTADGKQHSLKFDSENGVPMLTYNNGTPETLLAAQGPNGSFWYDPTTGKWYPENGMQIPLNQGIKDNGLYIAGENGKIVGEGKNPMTFNVGTSTGTGLNIPSVPETVESLMLFVSLFLAASFIITRKRNFYKKNN